MEYSSTIKVVGQTEDKGEQTACGGKQETKLY